MEPDHPQRLSLDRLRSEIVGRNLRFPTPFGERLMTYADYVASVRNVEFIEAYMRALQETYGNRRCLKDVVEKECSFYRDGRNILQWRCKKDDPSTEREGGCS